MTRSVRLLICIALFFAAVFIRWGSSLDTKSDTPGRQTLTYQALGTGGDPDYQLFCARQYSTNGVGSEEAWLHYDYMFLCPGMALIVKNFPLAQSFQIFTAISLVFGALAVVMPFALFSTLKKGEVGGFLASTMLLTNQVLIHNSDGRFFIYPLVVFLFTLFCISYIMALYKRTTFWLLLMGVVAIIQGISKPFLYVNDIALMAVFPILFCLQSITFSKVAPFIHLKFNWSELRKSFFPVQVYFVGIVGFEYLHHIVTKKHFFLSDLFLPLDETTKDFVLKESLHFEGHPVQKLKNIVSLPFIGMKLLFSYIPYAQVLLALALISVIAKNKRPLVWLFISMISITGIAAAFYVLSHFVLYPNIYVQIERYTRHEVGLMALFVWFLIFISLKTKRGALLVASHVVYFGSLTMALAAVKQPQLFITPIIWFSLLVAYAVNQFTPSVIRSMANRVQLGFYLVFLLIFMIPLQKNVVSSLKNWRRSQTEVQYLQWAKTIIPENGIVLGGIDDNFPQMSDVLQRTIIYNARYVAHIIPYNGTIHALYQPKDMSLFFREQVEDPNGVPLYMLDNNGIFWMDVMAQGLGNFPKDWFQLEVEAENLTLKRRVFRLAAKNLPQE